MLDPSNIPAHFLPLPEDCVLIGQGGNIPEVSGYHQGLHAINLSLEGDDWDTWNGDRDGYSTYYEDGLCYAGPITHPLVDANRELVESLNPTVVFPWMIVDEPSITEPALEPPIPPEGFEIIGLATELHLPRGPRLGEDVAWTGSSTAQGWAHNPTPVHRSGWFAARVGSEFHAHHTNVHPPEAPHAIPEAPAFRPLPDNLPPCPEGLVIVGYGDSYERLGRGRHSWWSEHYCWTEVQVGNLVTGPGCIHEVHAWAPDSPQALANAEAVRFYNPPLVMTPPDPLSSSIPLESWMRPIPEGHVYLGRGGTFRLTAGQPRQPLLLIASQVDQEWHLSRTTGGFRGDDPNSFYAVPVDHELARLNGHGATPAPAGLPLEPWMPPLPEGAVYIGRGGSFDRGPRPFQGWWVDRGDSQWLDGNSIGGSHNDLGYAVPISSPLLDLNPHLRPGYVAPAPVEATQPEPVTFGKRQWLLTLNGAPVSSLSELENLCSHLISKEENLTPLTECLWKALEYDDPESRIEAWASKEALLLMVDFLPDKSEADVLIPTIAESSKSIGEIITTAAAGVLLRGGLSNHFHYTEEGRLVINPACPPSLDQGCEILRRTLEVRETGQKLDNYSAWTLGMLGDELERFFGDDFDPSLVMEATGRCYNTYITSLKVYRELWANRRNLSFTHHKEALYAKVAPEDTTFILDTADRLRLSVAQQRKLTSFVRLYGSESFKEEPPDDADVLMERLEVKSVNKNYLFFLRSENKWFKYRGPFEHIPNGASPVFNADTRAMLDTTGQPTEMAEWTPVGVEIPYVRGHAATLEANRDAVLEADGEVERSHGGNTDRLDDVDDPSVHITARGEEAVVPAARVRRPRRAEAQAAEVALTQGGVEDPDDIF